MSAIVLNLVIEQGATFTQQIDLNDANNNPLDVSTYTCDSAMRRDYQSTNSYSFATTLTTGVLTISMSANNTANVVPGRYVWDAFMIDSNGYVARVVEGLVEVSPAATDYWES